MSQRKRIWGWFFYDWACQPFYTLMLTFFFAPYFATVAADFFISSGMETEASKAKAQTMWSICLSASGLFRVKLTVLRDQHLNLRGDGVIKCAQWKKQT